MQGALALGAGVLYVGRHETTAHVRPYDWDGRPISAGFSFRGPGGEPCELVGLDVDEDRHLWVADRRSSRVRVFTVFGREVATLGEGSAAGVDVRGGWSDLSSLALQVPGNEQEESSLWIARGGWMRHAVQRVSLQGAWLQSLRPEGNPLGKFRDVLAVAHSTPWTYVAEGRPGRIQVFRDGEFHFAYSVPARPGARFEPTGLAPLSDGRLVVACGGDASALLLLDAAGRLQTVLAQGGRGDGEVLAPGDVVLEEGRDGGDARLAVIDQDAERVQVFTLTGRCFGELQDLPGRAL